MLHLVILLVVVLPALLFFCFKPAKPRQPKSQVQQSSGNGPAKQSSKRGGSQSSPLGAAALPQAPSSGDDKPSNSKKMAAVPVAGNVSPTTAVQVAPSKPRAKKPEQQPSSSGNSHVAVRRGGASSAKLAKTPKRLAKTPKRIIRNRFDSLEAFTCEDPRTRDKTEEATQIANTYEGNSQSTGGGRLPVDKTAQTKESDWSLITAEDEFEFEQAKHQVMGNVDQVMAEHEDWCEYLGDRLVTETEITCDQPTDREMSAVICGNYRIWLADKIGSFLEAEGPTQ